jgi:pectin methylesterase-like acyl-CoA thioesterase
MPTRLLALLTAVTLSACSPKYDWRDYRSADAPYSVLFPGKPATQTRAIHLDQLPVSMTMTAANIDGVVFAVGSAQLADAAQAPTALAAMQSAMVNNIGGIITSSKPLANDAVEVDASGKTMRLIGRFIGKDRRVYQIVIIGAPQKIEAEQAETFFTSLKFL